MVVRGRDEQVAAADRIRKCHIGFQAKQQTGGEKLVVSDLKSAEVASGPGKGIMAVVKVERARSRNPVPEFPGRHMGLTPRMAEMSANVETTPVFGWCGGFC